MIEIFVVAGVVLATLIIVKTLSGEDRSDDKIIAFCTQCGQGLTREKTEVSEYDRETGRPIMWHIYTCPSKGWFNPEHDKVWYGYDQEGKLIVGKIAGGYCEFM